MASVRVMYGVAIFWVSSNSATIPYAPRTAPYILTYGAEVFVVEAIPVASRSALFRVMYDGANFRFLSQQEAIPDTPRSAFIRADWGALPYLLVEMDWRRILPTTHCRGHTKW